jgi:TonB family protein
MLVRTNPQVGPVATDPYVRKIASVCDMHRVPFGSPADLAGFMGALDENHHLAMDFWAIVARMSDEESSPSSRRSGEPGETSNRRMLEAIVEGVTGRSVAEVAAGRSEDKQLVRRLASMLAGEDVHRPAAEAEKVKSVEAQGIAAASKPGFDAAPPSLPPRTPVSPPVSVPSPALSPGPVLPAPVFQEPEPEPEPEPELKPELKPEPEPIAVRRPDENRQLVLAPKPSPMLGEWGRNDDPSSIQVFLEKCVELGRYRKTIAAGLLLLVAAGSGMFSGAFLAGGGVHALWQTYGGQLRAEYSVAMRQIQDISGEKKSYQFGNSNGGDYHPPGSQAGTATASKQIDIPAKGGASATGGVKQQSDQAVLPATQRRGVSRGAGSKSPVVGKHEVVRVYDAYSSASSSASSNKSGAVTVDAGVMKASLISFRVPAYPEAARVNHVEGRVVMQAIVSKSGTLGRLRVIDGDLVLRSAVSEALSKWRYRPYVVNGEPVEVAATVTVDFILDQ